MVLLLRENFVTWPVHDTARLTEAFRRAVLRLFVRRALFDEHQAAGMRTWPHAGFPVPTAVWVPEDDPAFATRLARYGARNPVAFERLTYDRATQAVTYRSHTSDGPTAGTETGDPLAFLARVLVHIPDQGHVTTRYDGWYANRLRGLRRQAEPAEAETPPAIVPALRLAPTEATRRWAAVFQQQLVEVDLLACPRCHGVMRLVACITPRSVIDRILAHLRTAAPASRTPGRGAPHRRGPRRAEARHAPHARPPPPRPPPCVRPPRRPATARGPSVCAAVPPGRPLGPLSTERPRDTTSGHPPRRGGGRRAQCCAPAGVR